MAVRRRKPQEGGNPETIIPPLGWLFGFCAIALYILAFNIPWFGTICIFFGNCSLLLALGSFLYWLFINRNELQNLLHNKFYKPGEIDLDIVHKRAMREFLFQANAVIPDPNDSRYQEIPTVEQTETGLKIEAIGNLREMLTSDHFRDSLESFLNYNGYDISIQNVQYHSDGWVYYTIMHGIESDRLHF